MSDELMDMSRMNTLGNVVAAAIAESLAEVANRVRDDIPDMAEAVALAAIINGGMTGVMQFMSDVADAGRLADADEKVGLMFKIAADVWTQMRGGPAGTEGGVQ